MKEKNVAVLATLFKKPEEDITKALEKEDGLQELVSEFTTNFQMFDAKDYAKLQENMRKTTISTLKEEDIPEEFKAKAVGWKLEKLEGELKDKYQFTDDFKGLSDLVDKIVTKAKTPPKEGEEEVLKLKQRIVDMEKEYDDKLATQQQEFDQSFVKTDFSKALNDIGLDYEGDVLKRQKGLLKAAYNDKYKAKRQDGVTVSVQTENDEVVKDNKFDPLPLKQVLHDTAKEFGFQLKSPDTGGHGGGSSKKKSGLSGVTFDEYLEKNNVQPNTNKADELFIEWSKAQ